MSDPQYAPQHPPTYATPPVPYQHPTGVVQPYQQNYPVAHPAAAGPLAAHASGQQLVSAGGRIGAVLLDLLLATVTLWIGWAIWSLITWSDGQTPAKKLLGQVVADVRTGRPFDWGQMALRELCIKGLLGWLLNIVTVSIYFWVDCGTLFGDRQRTLHDRMANSIVRHV